MSTLRKVIKKNKRVIYRIIDIICILFAIGALFYMYSDMKSEVTSVLDYRNQCNVMIDKIHTDIKIASNSLNNINSHIEYLNYSKSSLEEEIAKLEEERNKILSGIDKIEEKHVPENSGQTKTYMCYSQKWDKTSNQYALHKEVSDDVWYDENGYAKLGDRFFVAVKPYYGNVGDCLNVYQEDGSVIPVIIGDIKGMENSDIYIHHDGSLVEFMVKNLSFPGVRQTREDFWQDIDSIKNLGNYKEII